MDLDIQQHLPKDFDAAAKVWIYQSSRLFLLSEALQMEDMLHNFVSKWNSHGAPVKGYANLFFGRFIILMADETGTGVSGCSTDSSVHLIKEIEKKYGVDMFDRQMLCFIVKDKIEQLPLSQVAYAIHNKFIDKHTLYFNNSITTKKQLLTNWIAPAGETWLAKMFAGKEAG
ncbi:MAG: hypothetical protein H7X88_02885 [Gloeobacteraceae cyanobacterium ES-bin-316]|nr:hypothetical protein [Ferruginibacter sp.]